MHGPSHQFVRWQLLAALAVACTSIACAGDLKDEETRTQEPFPPGTITRVPASEVVCGDYIVEPGTQGPNPYADEQECIKAAVAHGTPAVLIQRSTTFEGDPIRQQFRVRGVSRIEVVTDYTRDRFASGTIHQETCYEIAVHQGLVRAEDCHDEPDARFAVMAPPGGDRGRVLRGAAPD